MTSVHQPHGFGEFPMDMGNGPFFGHHGHPRHHHHGPPPPFWGHAHGPWQAQEGPDQMDSAREADDASPSENEGARDSGPGDQAGDRHPKERRHGRRGRGFGHCRGGPRAFRGHCPGHHPFTPFSTDFARGRGGFPGHRGGPRGHGLHFGRRGGHFHGPPPFIRNFIPCTEEDVELVMGRFGYHGNEEMDFIPRADVFSTANEFVVHIPLPGAKKSDISVEYDAENSTLRLQGIVHRPGMTEEMGHALVVNERAYKTGVFERKLKLGHRRETAHIDADKITASLNDGILLVVLAKVSIDPEVLPKKIHVEMVDEKTGTAGEDAKPDEQNPPAARLDAMTIDSETEKGEEDEPVLTPGSDSDFSNVEEEEEGHEYFKVDVQ
ncbi:conserved hypothetical protein [Paecilomyces variotii No. 5]|uniref:SHSP domain-containing protein n=1 Tax=Byssochlamys spectabilis (strain No. 5 / NBRC 109023) TaxID=1356009 RepID=V5FNF7_BYSSN|nr:conserved hypothetical protein [Paecilomyces variotii No. 5]